MVGSSARLAPLTGLRFLAALHVVLFHFRDVALAGAPSWIYEVANKGYVSVGLFFVLSGFILVHAYVEPLRVGAIDRRAFWIARVARIYPVYLLALILGALTIGFGDGFSSLGGWLAAGVSMASLTQIWSLLPALLFGWPSWSTAVATLDWDFPVWSLGAEAFFYALFPFLAPSFARARIPWLLASLAGCWGMAVAPPLFYAAIGGSYPSDHALPAWNWVINYTPIFRLPEFLFGVALGSLYARSSDAVSPRRWLGGIAGALVPLAALGVLLLCFAQMVNVPGLLLANGLFDPLFGLIVYGLAVSRWGLAWVLARRPLVLLGEASYALYLLHVPLWDGIGKIAGDMAPQLNPFTRSFFVCFLLVTLSLSVAVFLLWERPARSFLRSGLRAPRHGVKASAQAGRLSLGSRPS